MLSFQYHNPTRLVFGEGAISELRSLAPQLGQRILLLYGSGSIHANGVYDQTVSALQNAAAECIEMKGVEPNPRLSTVRRGIEVCRKHQITGILAVGGGSVLDCAKAIAAGAVSEQDVWDIICGKAPAKHALPLGTILTLAATGSEMNSNSVITNWDTNEKIGWSSPHTFPRFSILDPQATCSVPREHTVNGIVDIMSHILEQYMHHQEQTPVQDQFAEALLRTVIETAPTVLKEPNHLSARATIMYCGTLALNGLLSMGVRGDWATHNLEHAVSAIYDIPHGGGLAILFPQWMRFAWSKGVGTKRLAQLAVRVFDADSSGSNEQLATYAIDSLQQFWVSLGAPVRLADYNIDDRNIDNMVERTMRRGPFGRFITLDREDVKQIFLAGM
jgi:alcohol dehydrogenase YqhD (iron-dependent ADH family)